MLRLCGLISLNVVTKVVDTAVQDVSRAPELIWDEEKGYVKNKILYRAGGLYARATA